MTANLYKAANALTHYNLQGDWVQETTIPGKISKVLATLAWYTPESQAYCQMSGKTLQKLAGVSSTTYKRALNFLQEHDLLHVEKTIGPQGGSGWNRYYVNHKKVYDLRARVDREWERRKNHELYQMSDKAYQAQEAWAELREAQTLSEEAPVIDEPVIDEPVIDEPVIDEPVIDEPVIDEPAQDALIEVPSKPAKRRSRAHRGTIARKSDKELQEAFSAFYSAYPRHVSRGLAFKSYKSLVNKKIATPEEILERAYVYEEYVRAQGTEEKFIPHPSTWLNAQDWSYADWRQEWEISLTKNSNSVDHSKIIALDNELRKRGSSAAEALMGLYPGERKHTLDPNYKIVYKTPEEVVRYVMKNCPPRQELEGRPQDPWVTY